jgi:assimilatory nitrate reductase catalytic subunit
VRIERFAAQTYGFAVMRKKPAELDADYWALAACEDGWRVELAFSQAARDWTQWTQKLFGDGADMLSLRDEATSRLRFAAFSGDRLAGALYLAPEPVAVARGWAAEQLGIAHVSQRARLMVAAGRPGAGEPDRGAIVCACFNVGVNQIAAAARTGCQTVSAIGAATQAGTNCGSCRAEIGRIIDAYRLQAAE